MKTNQQSGNILFNILLIIMFAIIAVLIYILAGGPVPKIIRSGGVQSPNIQMPINTNNTGEFSDGLINPDSAEKYQLDEYGAGISERDIFNRDINGDGRMDRITRTRNENGTSHFYYQYKIELNENGKFVDITPDGFRTTEGAECALQKLQFVFNPDFQVIKRFFYCIIYICHVVRNICFCVFYVTIYNPAAWGDYIRCYVRTQLF